MLELSVEQWILLITVISIAAVPLILWLGWSRSQNVRIEDQGPFSE
jgi:hypothetical protein